MLNFLSKCSRTVWKPVCHGKVSVYYFNVPTTMFKRSNVCSCGNISISENNIKGASKNVKILGNAFEINNSWRKESRGYVYLTDYQKCSFHSCSSLFSNKYKEYQDKERRDANVLIGIGVFFVSAFIFAFYLMDSSPYDKPSQKIEKL